MSNRDGSTPATMQGGERRSASRLKDRAGRRVEIVAAARAVMAREGYANTSTRDVAREAGIAPGLLHYYFPSKEGLLLEVVSTMGREMMQDWGAAREGISDPLERMTAGFDARAVTCVLRPEFFRLLVDLYALGLGDSAIRASVQEMLHNFGAAVREEVESLSDALPTPLLPPREAFDFGEAICAAFDGIALRSLLQERDPAAAYNAFKVMLLSLTAMSYVLGGKTPPVDKLSGLLYGEAYPRVPPPVRRGRSPRLLDLQLQ